MSKILIVAEKPSVASDIGKVLGVKKKGQGYIDGENYIISWAIGHLVTLAEPQEYDEKYKKWNKTTLPILPETMELKAIEKTRTQLKVLYKLMNQKEVTSIICATDSGREGELIFRYIYEITKCKKPFQRLWISSMTEMAIKEGFANLKAGSEYDNLYHSAKCRSEADWLVGMNGTRAYTIRYNALLSIGRVQTPTLALIVEKQREIDAFVIEEYYELKNKFSDFFAMWIDENGQTKLQTKEEADELQQKMKSQTATVTAVEKEAKKQAPPLLYDLTELQRECNRKFGYTAKKTLDIAQTLYEKRKALTYPRTDSRYLSTDMESKAKSILKGMKKIDSFQEHISFLEQNNHIRFTKRIVDNAKVTDHHAIIPTEKLPNLDALTTEEKNVYMLVAVRFMSVFFPYYMYEVTKAFFNCQGERLLAKGTVVTQEGWQGLEKTFFPPKTTKKKEEEQQLPIVKVDDSFMAEKIEVLKKKTTPPSPYTESTLLSAMEHAGRFVENEEIKEQMKDSGLGTPATRAAIIERLLSVGYLVRKGKSLLPTEKGTSLIAVVPKELSSPQTTGRWEKGLSSIAKGNMDPDKFMQSIRRYVSFLVDDADQRKTNVVFQSDNKYAKRAPKNHMGSCPSCGKGFILENSKSFYCTEWKNGCAFSIWKNTLEPQGIEITQELIVDLLKNKSVPNVSMTLPQTGERGTATLKLALDQKSKVVVADFEREVVSQT
ncbi:MAG: DNA topoisomerase III [Bacillota bacterium]